MEDPPLYEHDCGRCRHLGTDVGHPGEPRNNGVDLYVCEGPSGATLIRRYSSEPSNYGAVPARHADGRYAEAARRAGLPTVHRDHSSQGGAT